MVGRSMSPVGQPCWIDLMSSQPDQAIEFYGALFGWRAGEASPDFGGYFMFLRDGAPVAGAMPNPSPASMVDRWGVHVAVSDVAATLHQSEELGATVLLAPEPIGDLGVMAVFADPSGAPLGLWEPHDFQGFSAVDELNAPVWFELHTNHYDAVLPFYRDLFHWDLRAGSGESTLRYSTVHDGDTAFAGVLDATGHQRRSDPSVWSVYFGVENVDQALETVLANDGSVVRAPDDTPYGRMAVVRDPSGVTFRVRQ